MSISDEEILSVAAIHAWGKPVGHDGKITQLCMDTEGFITAVRTLLAKEKQACGQPIGSMHPANWTEGDDLWCRQVLLYSRKNQGDSPERRVMLYTHP